MGSAPSAGEAETLLEFAPEQKFALLRKLIPGRLQPMIRGMRKRWERRRLNLAEPYYTVFPYTQMSPSRQQNLVRLCEILEREEFPGRSPSAAFLTAVAPPSWPSPPARAVGRFTCSTPGMDSPSPPPRTERWR